MFENLTDKFINDPKQLFLFDGIGALISAFFLGIVLVQLQTYIGMPKSTLIMLGVMALTYAVYSIGCFLFLKKNWSPFLKIIAAANLLHCVITVYLMVNNSETLTGLGIVYFVGEIIIVTAIALLELKVANQMN